MKLLVFDNYDSFTWNIVHALKKSTSIQIDVFRNDALDLDDVKKYDKIILTPGPGVPAGAGLLLALLDMYSDSKPILGICLGHQAIAEHYGGSLINLSEVYHGVTSTIKINSDTSLFEGLPGEFPAGRYHSWIVNETTLPDELIVSARDENGYIMAMHHCKHDVCGVQFHPESILTPQGEIIFQNWLKK